MNLAGTLKAINTGEFKVYGNLKGCYQDIRINVLMPAVVDGETLGPKIEISSCFRSINDNSKASDYFSIRLPSSEDNHSLLVSLFLADRGFNNLFRNADLMEVKKSLLRKVEAVWAGTFDDRVRRIME